ncbi:MAG: hypothetical protein K0S15_1798 [Solirubrobacterales bacterium]|jgi:hypothetical protein|nr:hypothetical protein [Solirubrobacterales bacterium]
MVVNERGPWVDEGPKQLETKLIKAKRQLNRSRGELEAAQARIADLEQRLRTLQGSATYRLASTLWRLRATARAPFQRSARAKAAQAKLEAELQKTKDSEIWMSEARPPRSTRRATAPRIPDSVRLRNAVRLLGGVTEDQLAVTLTELSEKGLTGPDLLVVTDCDALRPLDEYGCRYEYIPPRQDWEDLLGRAPGEYEEFLHRRLAMIGKLHGVTPVGPDALTAPT